MVTVIEQDCQVSCSWRNITEIEYISVLCNTFSAFEVSVVENIVVKSENVLAEK